MAVCAHGEKLEATFIGYFGNGLRCVANFHALLCGDAMARARPGKGICTLSSVYWWLLAKRLSCVHT